jgi:hypothetical protein
MYEVTHTGTKLYVTPGVKREDMYQTFKLCWTKSGKDNVMMEKSLCIFI